MTVFFTIATIYLLIGWILALICSINNIFETEELLGFFFWGITLPVILIVIIIKIIKRKILKKF